VIVYEEQTLSGLRSRPFAKQHAVAHLQVDRDPCGAYERSPGVEDIRILGNTIIRATTLPAGLALAVKVRLLTDIFSHFASLGAGSSGLPPFATHLLK
jgi:hypothetical protein